MADEEDYQNGEEFIRSVAVPVGRDVGSAFSLDHRRCRLSRLLAVLDSLVDFLSQECLRKSSNRMEAEILMYDMIRAIKEYRHKSPLVHLCARFLGLIDEHIEHHKDTFDKTTRSFRFADATLDGTFLVVYLYMRRNMLGSQHDWNPPGNMQKAQALGKDLLQFPKFALILDDYQTWLPMEIVFDIVRAVLYFVPKQNVADVTAWIEEQAVVCSAKGQLQPAGGNRVVVRRSMRKALRRVSL